MSEQLDIVVTSIDAGASEAARRLSQAFDLSANEAEQFVRELPRVAKRNASREEAARYVEVLRAIGARVETLASEAPRETMRARMPSTPEQLVISVEHEVPAMRFRASGSLGMISVPPHDVLHPSFPKAPLIPHDLYRMPNGDLPMPSIRPMSAADENNLFDENGEPRRHTDAQMPPPLVLAAREMAISAGLVKSRPAEAASDEPVPGKAPSLGAASQPPSHMPLVIGVVVLLVVAAIALAGFVL